jgi:hypothetical protein
MIDKNCHIVLAVKAKQLFTISAQNNFLGSHYLAAISLNSNTKEPKTLIS